MTLLPERRTGARDTPIYLAACLILALAFVVMLPRLLAAEFGLLDDGYTVKASQDLGTAFGRGDFGLVLRLEQERGRFRPAHWLFNAGQYLIWGRRPRAFFLVNSAALGLSAVCLAAAVLLARGDRLAAFIAGLAYVLAPPVVENYYTLSKPEVPLTLWLAIALCCWAGARTQSAHNPTLSRRLLVVAALALLLAYFTKETAQVVALVAAVWVTVQHLLVQAAWGTSASRVDRQFLAVNIALLALFWTGWLLSGIAGVSTGSYSQRYLLSHSTLLTGLVGYLVWYVRDFPGLLPVLAFSWWRGRRRGSDDCWVVGLPVIWILAWTIIMVPWSSVLEYYLLPACLGVAMITGLGLAAALRALWERARPVRIAGGAVLGLVLLSLPATLGNSISNARVQLATDTSNARLIRFLSTQAPALATVLVNIPPPSEYVYEVLMHLTVLRGRTDLGVDHVGAATPHRPSPILIATPIMINQPAASARLGVYENGTKLWRDALHQQLPGRARLVYQGTERAPLVTTHLQRPFCPLLAALRAHNNLLCAPPTGLFDRREFSFGWEVYQIDGT